LVQRIPPLTVWVAIASALLFAGGGCEREAGTKLSVVTSTTMIETVVKEIGGATVSAQALVPGGMCPGHFDLKPRQMQDIERSDLFLYHGWEDWLPKVTQAMGLQTHTARIEVDENWMVPDTHIAAIHVVRDILISIAPDREAYFRERAAEYENAVLDEARTACETLRPYQGTPIICSDLQVEFLIWAGFDVLGTYGREESMTPRILETLIATGRREKVRLVVDNKQSGPAVGTGIADEIGAGHVVLTNFPVDGSYLDALRSNVEALRNKLG
jgi:zinc transport system substrate-binding protein